MLHPMGNFRMEGPSWEMNGWHWSLRGPLTLHAHTYDDGQASLTVRVPRLSLRVVLPWVGRLVDGLAALALGVG